MRVTSARAFVLIGCLVFLTGELCGQNCILTGLNHTSISSSCGQQCRDLKFQIPDISGSSTYTVVNIPYNPYPYVTVGATEDPTLYNDDRYSAVFSLPFPFCFFDSVYRKAVISSNGLVTFDTTYANCFPAAYDIDSAIPHAGFFSCDNEDYPPASIMAAFMDLDPRPGPLDTISSSPRDRKIEWRVEGTAPCRRFVVSYFHIGSFLLTPCGRNPDSAATFQIVMYESTGLIDVFFQSKFCSAVLPDGPRAILGVQDFSRTRAVAAPGKNATVWTASNEGYRFVPSGGASRFVSSELLAMDLSHVASATSSRSTPGLLDLTFPDICSAGDSTHYIVKTIYSACENPAIQLTSLDTITIKSTTSLNATATATNTACGPPSGTITVNVPASATPPFSYVLDGGAPITSSTFSHTYTNVAQGTHTVTVTGGNNSCSGSIIVTVSITNTLNANISSTASAACGRGGTITVTPVNGSAPYNFSLDGGALQTSAGLFTFINVPAGVHNVVVTDANGCTVSVTTTITQQAQLVASENHTSIACNGGTSIVTVSATGGTAPYTGTGTFSRTAGTFTFTVTDANGCTATTLATIAQPTTLVASENHTSVACNGGSSTVTVSATGGTAPYTGTGAFSRTAGTFTFTVTDANGCTATTSATITQPTPLVASSSASPCVAGTSTVTVSASGGTAPYTGTGTFAKSAGTYIFTVTDANGCTATTQAVVNCAAACNITLATVVTDVSCNGGNNGAINVTVNGASGATTTNWSNGATTQNITGLTAGTYTVTVTDANGCTASISATVTQPTPLVASETHTNIACNGGSTTVTVTATGGTAPYTGTGTFSRTAGTFTFTVTDANGCTATTSATIAQPTELVASENHTSVACNGGSSTVTVSATGGTAPYTGTGTFSRTAGTFTFTVTDANGCTATTSAAITQPTALVASSSASPCVAGTSTVTVSASGGTAPYTGTGTFARTAGTYTFTVTDANGCTATTQAVVNCAAACNINLATVVTDVSCNGGNNGAINLRVTGASGAVISNWSNGATTQNISALTAGTYTVTVTDANGCTTSTSATVAQPTPLVASETHTNIACNRGSSTITISATGGTAPYIGTGTFSRPAGTFSLIVTDNNGCADSITATISEPSLLTASATSTPITTIGGSDGTAMVTASGGTPPYAYSWGGPGGQTSQTASGLSAGSYTVTVTDSRGCTATANVTVGTPGCSISISFTKSDVSCFGNSNGTATVTTTGASGTLSYAWSNGQITQTATGLTAGSYSVTVTDGVGCIASGSVTITQPATLTVNATSTPITAIGSSDGTGTVTASGGTPPYTYLWSPGGQTSQTASGLSAGSYTVTVTDSRGCTATANVTVGSPGCSISISFTKRDASCFGNSNGTATVTTTGASGTLSYAWSNGQTTQTATGLAAGSYSVTVTDGVGCTASGSVTITQPATLTVNATSTPITAIRSSDGTGTVTASGGTPPYTYLWSPGGQTSQTASRLSAGSYTVTVTDSQGCAASANVTVGSPGCNISLSLTKTDASCFGNSNGTATVTTTGAIGTLSYAWSNGQTTQTASGLMAGSYSVTVTDGAGCAVSGSVTITQQAALTASSVTTNATCDARNNGTIVITAHGGNKSYQYSLDGVQFQTSNIFRVAPGNYVVTVKDGLGCTTTFNSTVGLNNDLHLNVSPHDTSSYIGDKFQLIANSTATRYTWFPVTGLSDPNVSNPVVTAGALGEDVTYRVTASTPEGCIGEDHVRIKAFKGSDIYVPTGFTPNQDGKNDKFTPIPVGIKKINYFKVFNRWGQMVFSSTSLNDGWDGKLGGVEQPGGVFVWMVQGITVDNRVITKKGTVVLIR